MNANNLPLSCLQMLIDAALERAEPELSNAVSTSAWKPHSGTWLVLKSELASAGFMCGPLSKWGGGKQSSDGSDVLTSHLKWTELAALPRDCSPLPGGQQCGRTLMETQGLRITACHPRIQQLRSPPPVPLLHPVDDSCRWDAVDDWGGVGGADQDGTQRKLQGEGEGEGEGEVEGRGEGQGEGEGPGEREGEGEGEGQGQERTQVAARRSAADLDNAVGLTVSRIGRIGVRGAWGSRIEQAIRLLLSLRAMAQQSRDPAACKAVIFSRMEPVLRLLARACAMNGVLYATYDAALGQSEAFRSDPHMQALLLSAHRDASGLTLTAASHVIIMEPQMDVATELQMIGRVHRIGQMRQAHVHRLAVEDSFEARLAAEREDCWNHTI